MLLFHCADPSDLPAIRREGLEAPALLDDLEEARRACGEGVLLAIDVLAVGTAAPVRVPPEAIPNLDPYLAPRPVTAAGGYVLRRGEVEPELLVIFRRGVWDLPKGKLDEGESVEACALREVREEVGIERLSLRRPLGTTVHGYPEEGAYRVKTTHWFWMETPERDFTPQTEEEIERVEWVPWHEARERLGFETLRRHMDAVTAEVVAPG